MVLSLTKPLPIVLLLFAVLACGFPAGSVRAKPPACNNEHWKGDIAKFLKSDEDHPPEQGAILFVGSSSIRLWDLQKSFPKLKAINRGFGGSQICNSTHYFDQLVAKHHPRIVVMYAGDNDIAAGKSPEQVAGDFKAFAKKMKTELPKTPLLYISIKPSLARWKLAEAMNDANQRIAQQCDEDKQLHYVDLWKPALDKEGQPRKELFREDGLHLNEQGYRLWNRVLGKQLAAIEVEK